MASSESSSPENSTDAEAESEDSGSTASGLADSGNGEPRGRGRDLARRYPWWVLAATFVGGIVVGVIAVGLLSVGNPDFGTPSPTSSATPTTNSTIPVGAQARVNAACLAVINEAQDTYVVLTDLGPAVQEVDLQQLDDIVRRLQPIETRLGQDLRDCRIDAGAVTSQPGVPATPQPTPSPTR